MIVSTFESSAQATTITERECDVAFGGFMSCLANDESTWKFRYDFMFHDYLEYVGLYLTIHEGTWTLRVASLKEISSLLLLWGQLGAMVPMLPALPSEDSSRIRTCVLLQSLHLFLLQSLHLFCSCSTIRVNLLDSVTRQTVTFVGCVETTPTELGLAPFLSWLLLHHLISLGVSVSH